MIYYVLPWAIVVYNVEPILGQRRNAIWGWCRWGVGRGLGQGSGAVGWCYVCVSLDSLCR